jgi:hypothetical protein
MTKNLSFLQVNNVLISQKFSLGVADDEYLLRERCNQAVTGLKHRTHGIAPRRPDFTLKDVTAKRNARQSGSQHSDQAGLRGNGHDSDRPLAKKEYRHSKKRYKVPKNGNFSNDWNNAHVHRRRMLSD